MGMEKYSAQPIQAFPLLQHRVNLVAGTHEVEHLIHCAAAGDIIVFWGDGTSSTIPMAAGSDFAFNGQVEIVALGGTFHLY